MQLPSTLCAALSSLSVTPLIFCVTDYALLWSKSCQSTCVKISLVRPLTKPQAWVGAPFSEKIEKHCFKALCSGPVALSRSAFALACYESHQWTDPCAKHSFLSFQIGGSPRCPDAESILYIAVSGTHQLWALFLQDADWQKGEVPGSDCPRAMSHSTAHLSRAVWRRFGVRDGHVYSVRGQRSRGEREQFLSSQGNVDTNRDEARYKCFYEPCRSAIQMFLQIVPKRDAIVFTYRAEVPNNATIALLWLIEV